MMLLLVVLSLATVTFADPTIYFKEEFDAGWEDRWVESTARGDEAGKFVWSAGKFYNDAEKDKGLQTSQDAKFYGISAKFDKPFSNKGKTLVIQFTVKHEQKIDCGGGYIKLLPADADQAGFKGETPYYIMFGPDICGFSSKKVHVIFTYNDKNLLVKKDIKCKDDELSHLYTLIVKPDNTYEVKIDNEKVESGELEADWDFLPPKTIKDPDAKKPDDWDDKEKMDDPEDAKPEDWDRPQHITDPDATKPDDWDDEMDGEWEAPQIDNPEYKGEWKAKQLDNPNYQGKWVHPEIDNPEYNADDSLYAYSNIGAIGFDLWQVKSGTIFDNMLVTDCEEYAQKHGEETWGAMKDVEKEKKEKADEEAKKKREEEEKRRKEEEEAKEAAEEAELEEEETPEDEEETETKKDEL